MDGSDDGSREAAESFAAGYTLRVLWQPNRGQCGGVQRGSGGGARRRRRPARRRHDRHTGTARRTPERARERRASRGDRCRADTRRLRAACPRPLHRREVQSASRASHGGGSSARAARLLQRPLFNPARRAGRHRCIRRAVHRVRQRGPRALDASLRGGDTDRLRARRHRVAVVRQELRRHRSRQRGEGTHRRAARAPASRSAPAAQARHLRPGPARETCHRASAARGHTHRAACARGSRRARRPAGRPPMAPACSGSIPSCSTTSTGAACARRSARLPPLRRREHERRPAAHGGALLRQRRLRRHGARAAPARSWTRPRTLAPGRLPRGRAGRGAARIGERGARRAHRRRGARRRSAARRRVDPRAGARAAPGAGGRLPRAPDVVALLPLRHRRRRARARAGEGRLGAALRRDATPPRGRCAARAPLALPPPARGRLAPCRRPPARPAGSARRKDHRDPQRRRGASTRAARRRAPRSARRPRRSRARAHRRAARGAEGDHRICSTRRRCCPTSSSRSPATDPSASGSRRRRRRSDSPSVCGGSAIATTCRRFSPRRSCSCSRR